MANKTTITIMDYLQSELINNGFNEFENNNQLVIGDDNFQFIKKIMRFDSDVEEIVSDRLFAGFNFDKSIDKRFKKMFVNRFLNRSIQKQTIEDFTSTVLYISLKYEDMINNIYKNIDNYIKGSDITTYESEQKDKGGNRNFNSTLPQSELNIEMDSYALGYADEVDYTISDNFGSNTSTTTKNTFDIDINTKISEMLEIIFLEYDKKCFLQTW